MAADWLESDLPARLRWVDQVNAETSSQRVCWIRNNVSQTQILSLYKEVRVALPNQVIACFAWISGPAELFCNVSM
jgi:hypothetical protein